MAIVFRSVNEERLHRIRDPKCEGSCCVPIGTPGTAMHVIAALRRTHVRYDKRARGLRVRGLFVEELRTKTGFAQGDPQRIDAFHMEDIPCLRFWRTAYEVKVTYSDFLREIKRPLKRTAAMEVSHEFYFAAPAGVIPPEMVPYGCGLISVFNDGTSRKVVRAHRRPQANGPTWGFLASMVRAARRLP